MAVTAAWHRIKRWWNRLFGSHIEEVHDTRDIHEYLVNRLREWEDDFRPDDW